MKYMSEFRDGELARQLGRALHQAVNPEREYRIMEFCGGHTHAVYRYGLADLLPPNVRLVHGPGCPVCVMPGHKIDQAIAMVEKHNLILCTYGDLFKVPGVSGDSFYKAKARGQDIRMVYSTTDAIKIAGDHPSRGVVFFAIGFETTTPPTASVIKQAAAQKISNFSVFCNHVLTPPVIEVILDTNDVKIDGFIGPAHVSTVIGLEPYEKIAAKYGKPVVVAGFEPLDLMQGILMLVEIINRNAADVENQYRRAVTHEGNRMAQAIIEDVFELKSETAWRGLGVFPHSGLKIRSAYHEQDAEVRYPVGPHAAGEGKVEVCRCGEILRGVLTPFECPLFDTRCTPDTPVGPCMVSSEGTCAAYYAYNRTNKPGRGKAPTVNG
jgi:hydrogenase expression/formation protein HypD